MGEWGIISKRGKQGERYLWGYNALRGGLSLLEGERDHNPVFSTFYTILCPVGRIFFCHPVASTARLFAPCAKTGNPAGKACCAAPHDTSEPKENAEQKPNPLLAACHFDME
jgi:hypothetical protein